MRHAKIQLSPAEQHLITNAEVLLTKNRVMGKIISMLEDVQEQMQQQAPTFSKPHILQVHPKISRGENYQGLPYLVLDYPRVFQQHDIFAIRNFFWWGHFFSSTLHVSGSYKEMYEPKLEAAFETFSKHHIGINADPWQHHFDETNYQLIAAMSKEEFKTLLHTQAHVKIAIQLHVEKWEQATTFFMDNWKLYLNLLL
ncbi:MAG: hypothetical protein ACJ749_02650 [Flavisolibacter sp.]